MGSVVDAVKKMLGRRPAERPAEPPPEMSEKRRRLLERLNASDTGAHFQDGAPDRDRKARTEIEVEKERLKERSMNG